MSDSNILITGHEGFIGKSVLNEIKTTLSNKYEEIFLFEKNDIDSDTNWLAKLESLIKQTDTIVHIGADSSTQNPNFNEVLFYNYYFSKVLFDFVGESEKKVIYSSSAACYGTDGIPSTIYGWSKYLAEQYGYSNVKNFYGLRYFNVYGPGESKKGNMASVANQAILSGNNFFKLFPGEPKRDFVYISDVVNANIYPILNNVDRGVYDVGSGEQNTFEKVLEILNINVEYYEENVIPGNYQFSTLASKEKFLKGWKPEFDLLKGLKAYKENFK